ncbi:MAG: hypothetical protein E7Z90_06535 [Cyanobacteria bacterium SIG29]|nr:hypothetical protein [Cyanobacteria bacterium SIG29]
MKSNSILIISNDKTIGSNISDKIKLLRECDSIKIVSYIESISVLNSTQPSIIILYCSKTDSAGIVKEIRKIEALNKIPIIFVMDSLVEELLFFAFDNGIDDFFFMSDPDSIVLMRIFLTLQKSVLYKQIEINNQILLSANIIDKQTGIYLKEQAPIALRNFFSKSIEENSENTVFMYLKPVSIENKRLNMNKIARIVKSIPRANDIVAFGKSSGFYLILYNAGQKGSSSVAERIRKALANECYIYANAAEITTSFEEMEPVLYKAMKEQIENNTEFDYLYDLTKTNIIEKADIKDEKGKKFKDFKKEFFSNFEKIVAPVFYQTQTAYAEKLKDAQINFNMNEKESIFKIEENNLKSELIISYPTYISIIIDIKHTNKEEAPLVRRLVYNFEDFSEEKLTSLLKDVINEFIERKSIDTIKQAE